MLLFVQRNAVSDRWLHDQQQRLKDYREEIR